MIINTSTFRNKITITIPVPSVPFMCHSCPWLPVLWWKADREGHVPPLAAQNCLNGWTSIPLERTLLTIRVSRVWNVFFLTVLEQNFGFPNENPWLSFRKYSFADLVLVYITKSFVCAKQFLFKHSHWQHDGEKEARQVSKKEQRGWVKDYVICWSSISAEFLSPSDLWFDMPNPAHP